MMTYDRERHLKISLLQVLLPIRVIYLYDVKIISPHLQVSAINNTHEKSCYFTLFCFIIDAFPSDT